MAGPFLRFGLWMLAGWCALVAAAAESPKTPPAWLVGKRFDQQLQQKMNLSCANASLGDVLRNLAANNHPWPSSWTGGSTRIKCSA